MPFGKLTGTKMIKKKPEPVPEPEPIPAPVPEPEPIPEPIPEPDPQPEPIPEPAREPQPEPVPPAPAVPDPVYVTDLQILVIGRTLGIQREYLAAMKENLTQMLAAEGLSFYIRDLKTITDMVDVSKKLGEFFFRFSQENWTCPADEASDAYYEFSISPAGRQRGAVHFGVHCVTPAAGSVDLRRPDAVWMIADGPMWSEDAQDGYLSYLRCMLSAASSVGSDVPVVLIQSQIEAQCRFRRQGTKQTLKETEQKKLDRRCRELFKGSIAHAHPAAMIPVQLYDGLEYSGKDAHGLPYLRLSGDGYHQMYTPVNCEMPMLYSLETIAQKRGIRLFEDTVRGGFGSVLQRYYEQHTGKKEWNPSFLADDTAAEGGMV